MWQFIKKYWDLVGGALVGAVLCFIAHIELECVQLYYSIIILLLVCIGLFRTIRQGIEKTNKRKHNLIDGILDAQGAVKAINLAQEPTKEGEKIGKLLLKLTECKKKIMDKIKTFFSKFKGYIFTIALAILTVVEMYGGFINDLCGGALTVKGVSVLPMVTLVCTAVVGSFSNGFTKEQREKIKALFSKSSTNELVQAEIKKSIKDTTASLADYNKILKTKETELANYQSELESAKNTHDAKKEMYGMKPQLATAEDVQISLNIVVDIEAKIADKTADIARVKTAIENLKTTLAALKSQL